MMLMRLSHRRPQLTLKAMIGLVALAAFLIWGGVTSSRLYRAERHYRHRAERLEVDYKRHHKQQLDYQNEVPRMQKLVDRISTEIDNGRRTPEWLNELSHHKKLVKRLQNRAVFNARVADWSFQLMRKYSHAASRPWEAVSPDPKYPPEVE
jgi:hypothetical protein